MTERRVPYRRDTACRVRNVADAAALQHKPRQKKGGYNVGADIIRPHYGLTDTTENTVASPHGRPADRGSALHNYAI